ncbi:hypothetical protein [Aporhodopirellula aestuarii]|uniref:Transmembrane protein n=1 Tax=Aporhodopirellula aestuarii TaxID=2950107 RepID=A0ABT0U748_9BACT|nr:hypothetical protein [Aporhodopirellula aestuarii]MCM2372632.1 hypothetical protein [Aporhodopirellula aestuarii]
METFEQIWETSRTNDYSWGYSYVVWSGVALLVLLSLVRHKVIRRVLKLVVIAGGTMLATHWSAAEIHEKWRLRREWADMHPDRMTQDGMEALTIDGANLTMGPLIFGVGAIITLLGVATLLFFVRLVVVHVRAPTPQSDTDVTDAVEPPIETGNPYQPPA